MKPRRIEWIICIVIIALVGWAIWDQYVARPPCYDAIVYSWDGQILHSITKIKHDLTLRYYFNTYGKNITIVVRSCAK